MGGRLRHTWSSLPSTERGQGGQVLGTTVRRGPLSKAAGSQSVWQRLAGLPPASTMLQATATGPARTQSSSQRCVALGRAGRLCSLGLSSCLQGASSSHPAILPVHTQWGLPRLQGPVRCHVGPRTWDPSGCPSAGANPAGMDNTKTAALWLLLVAEGHPEPSPGSYNPTDDSSGIAHVLLGEQAPTPRAFPTAREDLSWQVHH